MPAEELAEEIVEKVQHYTGKDRLTLLQLLIDASIEWEDEVNESEEEIADEDDDEEDDADTDELEDEDDF